MYIILSPTPPVKEKYIVLTAGAGYLKMVPSVYTILMNTIYLSLSPRVAEGTDFRKQTVRNHNVFNNKE